MLLVSAHSYYASPLSSVLLLKQKSPTFSSVILKAFQLQISPRRQELRKENWQESCACLRRRTAFVKVYLHEIQATLYFLFYWSLIMAWHYFCTSSPWGFREQSSVAPSCILKSTTQYLLATHKCDLWAIKRDAYMPHRSRIWPILGTGEKPIHVYCQGRGVKGFLWLLEASCTSTNYLYSPHFWSNDLQPDLEQVGLPSVIEMPGSYWRFFPSCLHLGWFRYLKSLVIVHPLLKVE